MIRQFLPSTNNFHWQYNNESNLRCVIFGSRSMAAASQLNDIRHRIMDRNEIDGIYLITIQNAPWAIRRYNLRTAPCNPRNILIYIKKK